MDTFDSAKSSKQPVFRGLRLIVGLIWWLAFYSLPATSATIVVNTENGAFSNRCDLSEAIMSANTDSAVGGCLPGFAGEDTIVFSLGFTEYEIRRSLGDNTFGLTATPRITSPIKLVHLRPEPLTIYREPGDQFRFFLVGPSGELTMENFSLQNGYVDGSDGGTILVYNGGKIELTDVEILNGFADNGGAIAVGLSTASTAPEAILRRCLIRGNSSLEDGGGIFQRFRSRVTILDSTFSNNEARGRNGGAISINGAPNADLVVVNSTIVENTSFASGGGISVFFGLNGSGNSLTIRNSIIAGNTAGASLQEVRFINELDASSVKLSNNLIGTSAATSSQSTNSASWLSNRNRFLTSDSVIARTLRQTVGPLADNGGKTMTHALVPNSLAIDAAAPGQFIGPFTFELGCRGERRVAFSSPDYRVDQRGLSRPIGPGCDIGAVEFEPPEDSCYVIKAKNGNVVTFCL